MNSNEENKSNIKDRDLYTLAAVGLVSLVCTLFVYVVPLVSNILHILVDYIN